jgi:hypothetical protein
MPYGPAFLRIYQEILSPVIRRVGLQPRIAREISGPGPIIDDIFRYIAEARIIIADITGRNPNVFYEIGLAHVIGKRVVLIAQNRQEDLPFDLQHLRCLDYTDDRDGWQRLDPELRAALRSVLDT